MTPRDAVALLTWPVLTPRLLLRPIEPRDADAVFQYRSQPEVVRYLSHPPLTRAQAADFARWGASKPPTPGRTRVRVVAELRETPGTVVGDAMLRVSAAPTCDGPSAELEAEIGYTVAPSLAGRGFATEMGDALVDLAFTTVRARRVTADAAAPNKASHRVLTKLGFRQEGVLIRAWRAEGAWVDALLFGLLREEWEGRR